MPSGPGLVLTEQAPLRYYDIHNLALRVESRDQGLFSAMESLTAGFFSLPASPLMDNPFILRGRSVVGREELPLPDESRYPLSLAGTPDIGLPMRLLVKPPHERVWLQQDTAVTICDLEKRQAEAVVVQGHWPSWGFQTLIPLLAEALGRQDMFLLHAGANLWPDGRSCVLFFGASGTGKTTTVLSLACQGWSLLCDDAGFLTTQQGQPSLWGLPRSSKVHHQTFQLLPSLSKIPRKVIAGSEECQVSFRDLPHVSPRERIPVRAIFLLQPRNTIQHLCSPLTATTVLPRLIQENMRVTNPNATDNAGRMFKTLSTLCKTTPCYSLSVGPDLTTLPEVIQALPASKISAC